MQEIEFIEAAGNYVRLHLAGGRTYLHRETIQRMEERLNALQFTRVHRSYIVNTRKVKEMEPCRNGEFILSLSGGKNIPCSRNYHFAIKALCSRL
jgi:two-component system LytT family response regulator